MPDEPEALRIITTPIPEQIARMARSPVKRTHITPIVELNSGRPGRRTQTDEACQALRAQIIDLWRLYGWGSTRIAAELMLSQPYVSQVLLTDPGYAAESALRWGRRRTRSTKGLSRGR